MNTPSGRENFPLMNRDGTVTYTDLEGVEHTDPVDQLPTWVRLLLGHENIMASRRLRQKHLSKEIQS